MIRVSVADAHAVVRRGVAHILGETSDITLVGESANVEQMRASLRENPCDILILDVSLSGRDGFQALHDLAREFPHVRLLVFGAQAEKQFAIRALRAGAAGYLLKASTSDDLVTALRRVHDGKRYVSPSFMDTTAFEQGGRQDSPLHAELTSREFQVFLMLAKGASTRGIADELCLSIKTIYNHRERIMEKLHARTNLGLIRYAVQHRLDD